jgi:uncharacterized membrane protein HdeD (DUF308 family)
MDTLSRNWGWVVLRGVLAILFGAVALTLPGIALATLVLVYGAYALVDGVCTIAWAIANRKGEPRWVALILGGFAGIAVGILTFLFPAMTAFTLLMLIAAWSIVAGVAQIVASFRLRKEITGEWLLGLAGLMGVGFGAVLIVAPGAGALALVLWIGAYAVAWGAVLIALGLRLRSWGHAHAALASV